MPGAKLIVKICGEYGCSSDWLLGLKERGTSAAASVTTGDNSAVAIGTNARATVSRAAPGERPDCDGCPYKEKMKEFEAFFNATPKKGKRK